MIDRDEFLRIWAAWDNKPHDPKTAKALVEADRAFAADLTLTTNQFRDLLAAWRRAGLTPSQALTALEAGLATARGDEEGREPF